MVQNNIQQPILKRFPTIWAIVISVVLTAVIVGGGVYLWQSSVTKNIQQQISNLQGQIDELQQPSKAEEAATTAPSAKVKVTLPILGEDEEGAKELGEVKQYGGEKELDKVMLDVIYMACMGAEINPMTGASNADQKLRMDLTSKYCSRFAY